MKSEEPLSPSTDNEDHHDPHFDPIISLPEVQMPTMEEDEVVLIQLRAKLFRIDQTEKEWKERGTGEVKLLHNEKNHTVRVIMRRDKTLKLCANHFVTPMMELKPNCGSDRAWVWSTFADFSDGDARPEILAIKFINAETAKKWKDMFETSKTLIGEINYPSSDDEDPVSPIEESDEEIVKEINLLNIEDKKNTNKNDTSKNDEDDENSKKVIEDDTTHTPKSEEIEKKPDSSPKS